MSQVDEQKEYIGWLKVVFTISTGAGLAVLGWLVQNYETAKPITLLLALLGVVISTIVTVFTTKKIKSAIRALRDM